MMANYLPDTKRVFLADGDALNLDSEYMIKIVKYIMRKICKFRKNFLLCNANEYSEENI